MKISWKILRIGGAGKWGFFEAAILNFFCFISVKNGSPFIWVVFFFCTLDGFSRIWEKKLSELLCTRLYLLMVLLSIPLNKSPWMLRPQIRSTAHTFSLHICFHFANTIWSRGCAATAIFAGFYSILWSLCGRNIKGTF